MATSNPIDGFALNCEDFRNVGSGLQRPECILAERDGTLWVADARGGVVRIDPDGSQEVITQAHEAGSFADADELTRFVDGTLPNGLAFDRHGNILVSNFGTDCLELMSRSGETSVMFDTMDDGSPIGKVNFVCRDSRDRVWITVSTMIHDWPKAISPNIADGRVLIYQESQGVRVVADGIHFANECKLDATEEHLYVVQTAGRSILRFDVAENGDLSNRKIFGPTDHGRCLDGIAFDAYGNLWGTYVFDDGIYAITPEGELSIIYDDSTVEEVERLQAAFAKDEVNAELLLSCGGQLATWCASLTFGGPDLRTVYIGSLRQTTLPYFRAPVAGLPMSHWDQSKP